MPKKTKPTKSVKAPAKKATVKKAASSPEGFLSEKISSAEKVVPLLSEMAAPMSMATIAYACKLHHFKKYYNERCPESHGDCDCSFDEIDS